MVISMYSSLTYDYIASTIIHNNNKHLSAQQTQRLVSHYYEPSFAVISFVKSRSSLLVRVFWGPPSLLFWFSGFHNTRFYFKFNENDCMEVIRPTLLSSYFMRMRILIDIRVHTYLNLQLVWGFARFTRSPIMLQL